MLVSKLKAHQAFSQTNCIAPVATPCAKHFMQVGRIFCNISFHLTASSAAALSLRVRKSVSAMNRRTGSAARRPTVPTRPAPPVPGGSGGLRVGSNRRGGSSGRGQMAGQLHGRWKTGEGPWAAQTWGRGWSGPRRGGHRTSAKRVRPRRAQTGKVSSGY